MSGMIYRQIPFLDKPVSRLVHGTDMITMQEKKSSFELLDGLFEIGVNSFDTAAIYRDGECVLGSWIQERGLRDRVVVITKGAHHNLYRSRVTPYDILSDLHDSLARLKMPSIDLYLLHRDDPKVPVGPIMDVLNQLHADGKIQAFGASNWTHQRIQEANDYAERQGLKPFSVSSPYFSLAEQIEDPYRSGCISIAGPQQTAARSWYIKSGMPVFAYSSLGRGFFSGRLKSTRLDELSQLFDQYTLTGYCYPVNFERLKRVEILAAAKNLTVPQIAMAWVMNQPMNLFSLTGAKNRDEMMQNIEALHLKLEPSEIDWLDLRCNSSQENTDDEFVN